MRSVILRSLAVVGAGGLVLAGVLYVASTVDTRAPTVVEIRLTQPLADDDRRASVTTSVEIEFSELIDTVSAADAVSLAPTTPGSVSWSGTTMTFTPTDPLGLDAAYVVTVAAGIRDLAGNAMTALPSPFEFATLGRPALAATSPSDGATDVPIEGSIAVTFSTLMDTASVEAELRLRPAVPHTLRWSGRVLEIIPSEPMAPATDYVLAIDVGATDVAGVPLGEPIELAFRTAESALAPATLIPADGIDGVSVATQIAIIFDRPIDPASVSSDLLSITPSIAGSLSVARLPDEPVAEDGSGRILTFTPSGQLPLNTTFTVQLAPGLVSVAGGGLATATEWSFTTGVPLSEISNQVTFITDRGGVANVWAMNPDGSGQRQLTAELSPVIDYAVAPDGNSLVVGDGYRLIHLRADGSDRRLLTDSDALEFDATFSPDGLRIAFARADRATGRGLGLWEWVVGSGEAAPITTTPDPDASPPPSPSGGPTAQLLRAPRYAPDGRSLAFVDAAGTIGMIELIPAPGQVITVTFAAASAPTWLPDASGVLVAGRSRGGSSAATVEAPVVPLAAGAEDEVVRVPRTGGSVVPTRFGDGAHVIAVAAGGRIAFVDADGALWLAAGPGATPARPELTGVAVRAGAFSPNGTRLVLEIGDADGPATVEVLDVASGRRTVLAESGSLPRWLP